MRRLVGHVESPVPPAVLVDTAEELEGQAQCPVERLTTGDKALHGLLAFFGGLWIPAQFEAFVARRLAHHAAHPVRCYDSARTIADLAALDAGEDVVDRPEVFAEGLADRLQNAPDLLEHLGDDAVHRAARAPVGIGVRDAFLSLHVVGKVAIGVGDLVSVSPIPARLALED
ncbi:MAG: hypothetical protein E5W25_07395, partial [Mesorhizobium sp.]